MNDDSSPVSSTPQDSAGHERSDVRPDVIGLFGLGLVGMVVVALPVLGLAFHLLEGQARQRDQSLSSLKGSDPSPGPKLQAQPSVELAKLRREESIRLKTTGWLDKERGVVHIPIEHAIHLLAQRGFPATETATTESKREDAE